MKKIDLNRGKKWNGKLSWHIEYMWEIVDSEQQRVSNTHSHVDVTLFTYTTHDQTLCV